MTNNIRVCLSPDLFHLYADRQSIVIVNDILRATTTMCFALGSNISKIKPVMTVEEALEYRDDDSFILAAERGGKIVNGFDFGNSPQPFMNADYKGKNMVMTTTNGTRMINIAKKDHKVAIGAFVNLKAITKWAIEQNKDIIICCSGWKGKFCLEDTLFAGALSKNLLESNQFEMDCDSTRAAINLYDTAKDDLYDFLKSSSHRNRLKNLNIDKDVVICVSPDLVDVVPVLKGDFLEAKR